MAQDITLTSAVRTNLISLQNTADLLATTQERLSTGKKVNSAIDDPIAFFTAKALENRASDLSSLLDNAEQGIQTLKAASSGLEAISDLLDNAKAVLKRAQDKSVRPSSQEYTLTGTNGNGTDFGAASGNDITYTLTTTNADGSTTAQDVTITDSDSTEDVVASFNALTNVSASFDSSTNKLTISQDHGRAVAITSSGGTGSVLTQGLSAVENDRDSDAESFNELLTQIDQLASDAIYKGINLLRGDDLTIYFNEDQTSHLNIDGAQVTTKGILNLNSITADQLSDNNNILNRIGQVDSAIGAVRAQSAEFGSDLSVVEIRSKFTTSLINTLEEGAAALTLADTNEEGANLLALQTRQQLSTVSLSLASQAEQSVLRLF